MRSSTFIVVNVDRSVRCSSIGQKDWLPSTKCRQMQAGPAKLRASHLVETAIRLSLFEDEPTIGLAEVVVGMRPVAKTTKPTGGADKLWPNRKAGE